MDMIGRKMKRVGLITEMIIGVIFIHNTIGPLTNYLGTMRGTVVGWAKKGWEVEWVIQATLISCVNGTTATNNSTQTTNLSAI